MPRDRPADDITLAEWTPVVAPASAVIALAVCALVVAVAPDLAAVMLGVGVVGSAGLAAWRVGRRRDWVEGAVAGACAVAIFVVLVAFILDRAIRMAPGW